MYLRSPTDRKRIAAESRPRRWDLCGGSQPMRRLLAAVLALCLILTFAFTMLQHGTGTAQEPVELGADTDISGNSSTSVGTVDNCISVSSGDTFNLDIFVSDVTELIHWELYLKLDPSIVEVTDADMRMFLNTNSQSSLKTQWIPYANGRHFLGAADLKGAPESGSGVLARLTLHAKAPGLSSAEFLYDDLDSDGDMDIGPRLTALGGIAVGDVTGDGVFDDQPETALIAVDESCDTAPPAPTPPPSSTPSPTPPPGDDTSPPDDVLPVPGDPTFEPPTDTSAPTDDGSASEGEPDGPSEAGPTDENVEGSGTNGTGEGNGDDDSEDAPAAAVLAGEGTPAPSGDSAQALSRDSSSGGGLPLWAIGLIAAAVLVAAAGTSVFLATRAEGRFTR